MKKKLISLLVLLMAAVSGAWADELSESFTTNTGASVYTGEHFKITPNLVGGGDGFTLNSGVYATIEALNGEIITKVELTKGFYDIDRFHCEVGTTNISGDVATVSDVNNTSLTFDSNGGLQIKAVKVYYTIKPFEYTFSVADCDHGTGKVQFFIGGKEVKGAYQADEGKEVTVTVTPDAGWIVDDTNVKAESYTTWDAAGARRRSGAPANIEILGDIDLTYVSTDEQGVATFTFTMPASNVLVTPAYKKVSTLYFDPAGKLSLVTVEKDGTTATPTDGKLTNVLEGSAVKMTANQGYKFRKVAVKKGAALKTLTIGDVTLTYADGDTWEQVIAKNSDKIRKSLSDDVDTVDGSAFLRKGADIVKITHTVYPNATDYNWYEM